MFQVILNSIDDVATVFKDADGFELDDGDEKSVLKSVVQENNLSSQDSLVRKRIEKKFEDLKSIDCQNDKEVHVIERAKKERSVLSQVINPC